MSENNIMEGITLTSSAADKVKSALKVENKEGYYLRMSVKGGGCSGMTYKMSFDNEEKEFDKIFESEGIKIVCDLQSWMYLKGTNILITHFSNQKDCFEWPQPPCDEPLPF